ncbi:hypothetical protein SDJN02_14014 [Cucurbita argyrosperma subsp. argyrosperma]|nr:hypothetical protein SDJN02_14014 [Cucurbita argyrosperma subsp. argyrosperma]
MRGLSPSGIRRSLSALRSTRRRDFRHSILCCSFCTGDDNYDGRIGDGTQTSKVKVFDRDLKRKQQNRFVVGYFVIFGEPGPSHYIGVIASPGRILLLDSRVVAEKLYWIVWRDWQEDISLRIDVWGFIEGYQAIVSAVVINLFPFLQL